LNNHILFFKTFSKRSAICFFVICFLFLISILRIAKIVSNDLTTAQTYQNRLNLSVGKQRGTIFDCNNIPLTNKSKKIIAAVSPTPRAITAISHILEGDELEAVLSALKHEKPVLCEVPEFIDCDGIVCTEVYEHSEQDNVTHIIGYTDNDLNGMSGIEYAYNDILTIKDEICFLYECDGKGKLLEGLEPTVINSSAAASNGVITTLDINIQSITETVSENIEKGAIIVADAKSGKIRACVSRPTFNTDQISEILNSEEAPLLNRAINAYNVGSVFKPCVAIAGIESNLDNYCYTCTGKTEIIDRFFKCHMLSGHGFMNLRTAIANSCNTYFYNYAIKIGSGKIHSTATNLRFGKPLKLCDGIYTSSGNLPSEVSLRNDAYLANFSIGQGELLLSPVSMLTLYCAIASDGSYSVPSIVEGTVKNGGFEKYESSSPTRVMNKETAAMLRDYLKSVLSEGTGESARPKTVSAAGKTATAQTGKYVNGVEICQGWFCGFFPAENPEYVIIVFSEDTSKQKLSCSEVFSFLADKINFIK